MRGLYYEPKILPVKPISQLFPIPWSWGVKGVSAAMMLQIQ